MKKIINIVATVLMLCFNVSWGQQEDAGITPASLAVSPTGAITYNVPIVNLPTVKSVAPSISLNYNGQSTNNIAGYGWRIGGLSTITRIASTKYHDGQNDPIDFDSLDRFSLDGQRLLLKTGTYGANGSTYETENYSNLKIEAVGVSSFGQNYGPAHFIVTLPDGSTTWYGLGTSSGKLEWSIYKSQDAQGNFIEYDYLVDRNLLRINSIKYGSRTGTASPNKIQFVYKNRTRREEVVIENTDFGQIYLLDRIEVLAGSNIFRKYQLKHQTTSLGYDKVISVTEINGENKSLRPITFNYKNNFQSVSTVNSEKNFGIPRSSSLLEGIDGNKHDIITGEFDGDNEIDLVLYDKIARNKLFLITQFGSVSSGQLEFKAINTPKFGSAFASTTLSSSGKVTGQQGITTISSSGNSFNFTTYFKEATSIVKTNKSWVYPTYEEQTHCGATPREKKIPREFISGDFNGDGLTDVLAVQVKYDYRYCIQKLKDGCFSPFEPKINASNTNKRIPVPIEGCCECENRKNNSSGQSYFIDLAKSGRNFSNYAGSIGGFDRNNSRLIPADFNGDGKTDILKFTEGNVSGYSLTKDSQLNRVFSFSHSAIKLAYPALIGDYNGDGNYDFMIPKADGDRRWTFFYGYSNGYNTNGVADFTEITFRESKTTTEGENQISNEYHYIVQDFTNDGKTDILFHEIKYIYDRWGFKESNEKINLFVNKPKSSQFSTSFLKGATKTYKHNWLNKRGIPVYANFTNKISDANYSLLAGNTLLKFSLDKNPADELKIRSIEKNYITTEIIYDEDQALLGESVYKKDNSSIYPYMDISSMKGVSIVSKLTQRSSGIVRHKKFHYYGAKSHADGFGFLGFKVYGQTNWHGDGVGTLWTNIENDALKRGVTFRKWVSTNPQTTVGNYSSLITNKFFEEIKPNKRYDLRIKSKTTENALEGYTMKEEYQYDTFYNPTKTTTTYPGGSKTLDLIYYNNSSGSGKNYYVGRLKQKKASATIKSESFSTTESYQYANNLLTVKKISSNGSAENTFYYSYDLFGNVTGKVDHSAGSRSSTYKYDTSGRYMISSKDHFGLETKQTFNKALGTLKTLTDPHGITINFKYDGWNRETASYEKTNQQTKTLYKKSGRIYSIQVNADNGPKTQTETNQYGWVLTERAQGFKGRYTYVSYKYDTAGRVIARSEPYYSADGATQWNKTYYDLYGRVIREESYTGQVVTSTYDKMTVTVNDGTKTVSTTKDVAGNVSKVTDPGGTITYSYFANGEMKETNYNSNRVTTKIDKWGRRIELNDPSAGIYKYSYNNIGELLEEQTPTGGKTVYKYTSNGLIENEKQYEKGELSSNTDYIYDSKHRLVKTNMSDVLGNKNHRYSNETFYNNRNQIIKKTEFAYNSNGATTYTNSFSYDAYNRIAEESYETDHTAWAIKSDVKIKNLYDAYGNLVEIYDSTTNKLLWRLNDENVRGQTASVSLGNGMTKSREYDSYGFLTKMYDYKQYTNSVESPLEMVYNFDPKRAILKNRTNKVFNRTENFTYDVLNRLTRISGAVNEYQSYDPKGLIQNNPNVGYYKYEASKQYQLSNIDLNNSGKQHYESNTLQNVEFDSFKRPLTITERNKDKVYFQYGISGNRSVCNYGNLDKKISRQAISKSYSSIMPVEIIGDSREESNPKVQIITYIGGDAYSAPIAHITAIDYGDNTNSKDYHYIHRDYLGSILGLTDDNGGIEELIHYGAWGSVDLLVDGGFEKIKDISETKLQRGFTGHEHLDSVGLIHMNGRLYDSKLRRFLSPDNYIQDPYNTQSFNRYGYVWNNPLNFNDPNGEWIGFVIGAIVGAYLGGSAVNGSFNPTKWDWKSGKTWAGIIGGALLGGFSGGQIQAGNLNLFVSAGAHVNSVTIPLIEVSINAGYAQLAALGGLAVFGKEIFDVSNPDTIPEDNTNELDIIENSRPILEMELIIVGVDPLDYNAPYPAIGELTGVTKLLTEIQVNNPQIFGPLTTPDGSRYLSLSGYPFGWVPKQSNGPAEFTSGISNFSKLKNTTKLRSFTKSNYLYNLRVFTGKVNKGFDAHHVFPQARRFQQHWKKAGINIHHPTNMVWWKAGPHRSYAKAYNKAWDKFFGAFPNATKYQIERYGHSLVKTFKR